MVVNSNLPKWPTPERRTKLIDLFTSSGGFCVFGHKKCLIPEHHYELFIDALIADWKEADREQREAEWFAELQVIHSLGEYRYPILGRFNAISKEIYGGSQPLYYIEAMGMSGITLTPFAKVRLSSSYMRLHIDLGSALRVVSKSKRRKIVRYGKPLPKQVEDTVFQLVREAVKHYSDH